MSDDRTTKELETKRSGWRSLPYDPKRIKSRERSERESCKRCEVVKKLLDEKITELAKIKGERAANVFSEALGNFRDHSIISTLRSQMGLLITLLFFATVLCGWQQGRIADLQQESRILAEDLRITERMRKAVVKHSGRVIEGLHKEKEIAQELVDVLGETLTVLDEEGYSKAKYLFEKRYDPKKIYPDATNIYAGDTIALMDSEDDEPTIVWKSCGPNCKSWSQNENLKIRDNDNFRLKKHVLERATKALYLGYMNISGVKYRAIFNLDTWDIQLIKGGGKVEPEQKIIWFNAGSIKTWQPE